MTSIKFLSIAAMSAAVMTSCNSNDDVATGSEPVEIRLSSGVSVVTRATAVNDSQFAAGETAFAYVDDHSAPATALYSNNQLTANGTGGFPTVATTMYFPQTGANVDIYAAHPSLGGTYPTGEITHTVQTNQSDDGDAIGNYSESDLLYTASTNVAKTTSAVELTFYHQLAKVRVAIRSGAGSPNLTGARVSIVNTKPSVTWTPDKSAAANAQTLTATGTATNIEIGSRVSADFAEANIVYNEAVIVPQTLAEGSPFIEVELAEGGRLYYKAPAGFTLTKGYVYTYEVTVNLTGLTVSSIINDWSPVSKFVVNAEM